MATGARRATGVLVGLSAAYFCLVWLPSFNRAYGYFIDELYYLACARHLAFGFVDHPPLSILLLKAITSTLGDTVPAIRFVPGLAAAGTVFVTGVLAHRLGAGAFGQAIAAGAVMVGGILHIVFGIYSMNAVDVLLWAVAFWILIEIEQRNEPRWWLVFGVVAGLALENKHTFVLLLLGLGVGLILSPARRHLVSRQLWAGAALALLLLAPNLIWQQAQGWPSLEFYRNADVLKNVPTPPLDVLAQQVLFMNPIAAPIWIAGLVFLLATDRGRPYRHLGWTYVALLALMLVGQKSRPDRIANAYPILFAAGGVLFGEWVLRPWLSWLRWALPSALVLAGAALAPIGLPILAPATTAAYAGALGIVPQIERGEGKRTHLPQWLADRLGWAELAADVASVADRLTPAERARAVILAPSYGQAGAIEQLGRGLPSVYATQNSYFHWGPPPDSADVAIVIGPFREEMVERFFDEVQLAAVHDCEGCMPWRDEAKIWIARRPMAPFSTWWRTLKHYE